MEKTFSPIIITSSAAQNHLNDIKAKHADILKGIQDQSLRVAQYNADKEAQRQMEAQQNQQNLIQSQKNQMDFETKRMEVENKNRELDIKANGTNNTL